MTTETKKEGLDLLRERFPDNQISHLPKPTCKNDEWKKLPKASCKICGGYHATSKTIHLSYVGHAALTDRLLDADPLWSWEPLAFDEKGLPAFDSSGGLWIRLVVCGVMRIGYGHAKNNTYADIGSREKEVIGDALRNAAMRFGAALELWHKGDLHVEQPDEKEEKSHNDFKEEVDKQKDPVKYVIGNKDKFLKDLSNPEYKKLMSYANQLKDSMQNPLQASEFKAMVKQINTCNTKDSMNTWWEENVSCSNLIEEDTAGLRAACVTRGAEIDNQAA